MRVVEGHVALTISVQIFFVIGERLTQGKVLVSFCSTSFCSEHRNWNSLDSCTFTAYLPASVIAKYGGFARQPVISNLLVPSLSGVQFSFRVFPVSLLSKAPQVAFEEQDSRHGHLSVACNDDISISGSNVGYWNHNVRVGSSVLNRLIFGIFWTILWIEHPLTLLVTAKVCEEASKQELIRLRTARALLVLFIWRLFFPFAFLTERFQQANYTFATWPSLWMEQRQTRATFVLISCTTWFRMVNFFSIL